MLQHPFDENAVSLIWRRGHDMGHRADDLAILHDRRTAHALDDPAALLEQAAVCDAELDPLHVILRIGVQSGDLDVKRLDLLAF